MRLAAYATASTVAASGVVLYAFNQRANFYSACVYLAQSNLCLMILTNLILLITCSFFYALQRLCYGPLRPIEIEQLYEKAWFAITETCLAMTIFREEVGAWFLVMFVALLAGKVWGWIGEGRVEILEQQPPANPRLFHARLSSSLALSLIYDASVMSYTINTVIQQARPNMMVMFLFEFAILTTSSFSTALRYGISLVEARITKQQTQERLAERRREIREARAEAIRQREANATANGDENNAGPAADLPSEEDVEEIDIEVPGWEAKGQWVLTLDLITDLFKLAIYSIFFCILLSFYGLPIHIMRDLFLTARSFVKRLTAFLRYRRATQDMNRRYPDATVDDIAREDTCIICREEMRPWVEINPPPRDAGAGPAPPRAGASFNERSRPKKLPCGHILHLGCLKSWLERQQVCPTCRRPVDETRRQAANRQNIQANNAPAPQEPHQPGAAPAPAPPRANGGMRMINFGPIRVGFGQANMQDIAQQLGGQQQNPDARVFGLELGFPRNNRQPQQHQPPSTNGPAAQAQVQLQLIEQQIMQQIRALQLTQQELHMVQLLQAELTRLRNLQNGVQPLGPNQGGVVQLANVLGANAFTAPQPFLHQPVVQRHAVPPGTSSIPSGSSDLPPGVTIPEGWSLLPLQRIDRVDPSGANTPGAVNVSRTVSTNVSPPNLSEATTQTAASNGAVNPPVSNLSVDGVSTNTPPHEPSSTTTTPEGSTARQETSTPNSQYQARPQRVSPERELTSLQQQAMNMNPELARMQVMLQTQAQARADAQARAQAQAQAQAQPNGNSSQQDLAQSRSGVSPDSTPPPSSVTTVAESSNNDRTAPPATVQPLSSSSSNNPVPTATPEIVRDNEMESRNETQNENEEEAASEERRQAKGKARAVTVEDSVDEE